MCDNFDQQEKLFDPAFLTLMENQYMLRSYQADALRNIYDAAVSGRGGRFAVTFPRQSGKNETQAQLEAALMAAFQHKGGSIIKLLPTEKNQGKVSTERLASVLRGRETVYTSTEPSPIGQGDGIRAAEPSPIGQGDGIRAAEPSPGEDGRSQEKTALSGPATANPWNTLPNRISRSLTRSLKIKKDEISVGSTRVRCLSASPNSAIVGATADILLEVDEAQMVPCDKFDREAAPMAASTNAVQVFWGTAWDDRTLLYRESRLAQREEEKDGRKHVFTITGPEVGKEVPAYDRFLKQQIEVLGRDHPAVRTQFFCEEISDLTSMFTPEHINRMKGDHLPLYGPELNCCYVFLIDVAGSDEISAKEKRVNGFSDRRDATVLTICEVTLPEGKEYKANNFVWKVVGRRLYRNLPSEDMEKQICEEADRWNPARIIIDHSGLGVMLSDILLSKYKAKVIPVDINAANKTKMAWDFLAMVDTGRWIEHKGDEINVLKSGFVPGREKYEILKEPELLQQMFYRELRACSMDPGMNGMNVRWGVKEGTRDHVTKRIIHDDLVMSAALAVFESGNLPVSNQAMLEDMARHYERMNRIYEERRRRMGWR